MIRPINDSLAQLTRKHETKRAEFRCQIQAVNYINRKLRVTGHGYGGPKKVSVQQGIELGTPDRPKVFVGDIATVRRDDDGRWLAIAVKNKVRCATGDVEIEADIDTSQSYTTQSYGATITPLDLFFPPIQGLGELTLPALRLPASLCGIPLCCTSPPLDGQSLMYDADLGCLNWGFRCRVCTGTPVVQSQLVYDDVTSPLTGQAFWVMHPYVVAVGANSDKTNSYAYLINAVRSDAPVIAGTPDAFDPYSSGGVKDMWAYTPLTVPNALIYTTALILTPPTKRGLGTVTSLLESPSATVGNDDIGTVFFDPSNTIPYAENDTLGWLDGFHLTGDGKTYVVTDYTNLGIAGFGIGYAASIPFFGLDVVQSVSHTPNSVAYTVWTLGQVGDVVTFYGLDTNGDLQIYDLSDPTSPALLGTLSGSADASDIRVDLATETVWYVDQSTNELVGIDVSNPASPAVVATESLTGVPLALAICNSIGFIALSNGSVLGYNLTDPTTPTFIASDTLTDFTPQQRMIRAMCSTVYVLGQNGAGAGVLGILSA